jgi:predicted MPP superfamily phosphohydrolase
MFWRFFIFFVLIVLIELYFIQAVKTISADYSIKKRTIVLSITYVLAGINAVLGLISLVYPPPEWNAFFRFLSSLFLILFICKLIGSSFLLIDDLIRLFRWIFSFIGKPSKPEISETVNPHHISRLKFFSYLAVTFTVIPAVSFIYGMIKGAYKYRVHKVKVSSPNLPDDFVGFKIVQLSDIHCGSFIDSGPLEKAFNIVLSQNPDLILVTGDLVNNEASETNPHLDVFKMLKAPHGVYSVLGNHDYGDYKQWESVEQKKLNLDTLKKVQSESGWRLLMNEHVAIEKGNSKIGLLGIENWGGRGGFPKYGKMHEAHAGTDIYPFKILMSHDPSHWDLQVTETYKDVDLTLSGHTHGMQFGIEIPGFRWSPSQYIYKQWAGLYKNKDQYLYVNRGLGFLGYPGRLGIWPEITVIELSKA